VHARLHGGDTVSRLRNEDGFTMAELLVAMVLAMVVFGAVIDGFVNFLGFSGRTDRQAQAQDGARTAIDQLARLLRNTQGDGVNQGIRFVGTSATNGDLIFKAPIESASLTNNAQGLQWVRYCLDQSTVSNQKLIKQTAAFDTTQGNMYPSATTCPSVSWSAQLTVADHLINYQGGKTTGCPCASTKLFSATPDAQGQYYDVKVAALVDVDPSNPPASTELRSNINLRNTNRAPKPSLTCQGTANKHITCDASPSYDPDGQPLTFQWQQYPCGSYTGSIPPNTCPWIPGQTSYTFDSGVQSSGTHYVTVEATDPWNLFADGQTTVTVP
jgi:type II secretory pathway pseudopilin PulG